MKKLFRFLTMLLFVNAMSTTTYAMVEQKGAQAEQKIPQIKATGPEDLVLEIRTELLANGFSPESIVAAIKQQKVDVNARSETFPLLGWTALHMQAYYICSGNTQEVIQMNETVRQMLEEVIKMHETVIQILVNAGAEVNARIKSSEPQFHDLTALEMLARDSKEIEKLKTPGFLISRGADISRILGKRNRLEKVGILMALRLGSLDKKESIGTLADCLKLISLG